MNEVETFSILKSYGGSDELLEQINKPVPDVDTVLRAMRFIILKSGGKMTRIHFHSFGYHMSVVLDEHPSGKRAPGARKWTNELNAVTMGSIAASIKACGIETEEWWILLRNQSYLEENYSFPAGEMRLPGSKGEFISQARSGEFVNTFAPVLSCRTPKYTVGLGDTISASGFLFTDSFVAKGKENTDEVKKEENLIKEEL